jgi:hypothetical protein
MKVEKFDNPKEYIHYSDLNLQSEIYIYGKKFRICDCDEFTKKFLIDKGISLNPPEPLPEIDFEDKFMNFDLNANKESISQLKEYIEVKLGGGHPNRILKQFLENDRKVLKFDIMWYDEKYDKEEKHYLMHFFLSDGMVLYSNLA